MGTANSTTKHDAPASVGQDSPVSTSQAAPARSRNGSLVSSAGSVGSRRSSIDVPAPVNTLPSHKASSSKPPVKKADTNGVTIGDIVAISDGDPYPLLGQIRSCKDLKQKIYGYLFTKHSGIGSNHSGKGIIEGVTAPTRTTRKV